MHCGIFNVVINNGVIVIDVSFKDTFSGHGIISLGGEGRKFLFPGGFPALFQSNFLVLNLLYVISELGQEVKNLLDGITRLVSGRNFDECLDDGSIGIEFFEVGEGLEFSSDFFNFGFKLNP